MRKIKRAMHFDFHTMPGIYDFNKDWDAEEFAESLVKAHIKYINFVAQCNIGFSYYKTKTGVMYKQMKGDMFGEAVRECHKRDIGVTAYFSGGLNHEQALRHPEWLRIDKEGHVINGDRTANFFRTMCFNTGYKEYFLNTLKEILVYDVDGIFIDSLSPFPCYCPTCTAEMLEKGIDINDDIAVMNFSQSKIREFCVQVRELAGPDLYLAFNGAGFMPDLIHHVEVECLPAGVWGYDTFAKTVAYARNITDNIVYMTGRFQRNWGDFGGYRTNAAIENDLYDALLNGVNYSIGDHMHPKGIKDNEKIIEDIGKMYGKLIPYEKWTESAKYLPEIGVIVSLGPPDPNKASLGDSVSGLARMLGELKYNFDILNINDIDKDYSKYACIILPDELETNDNFKVKIEQYLLNGGKVLSTGFAGLNEKKTKFFSKAWDYEYFGRDDSNSSYFTFRNLPDTSIDIKYSMYKEGILIKAKDGEKVIADYWKPYFNRHWDGLHGYFYTPPEKETGMHAAVITGNVAHVCFKVFEAYYCYAMREHKLLVSQILEELIKDKRIKTNGLSSSSRVTVTGNEKYNLVHCKVTYPEVRGKACIIEEHYVQPAGARIGLKGKYSSVCILPEENPLRTEEAEGMTWVNLPQFTGFIMLRFDKI